MHAALSGSDEVRSNLGVSTEVAAAILGRELTSWQSIYFGMRPTKKVTAVVEDAQARLAQQVIAPGPGSEASLELYTLLEALKHPSQHVSFRIVLPNLKLLREGWHGRERVRRSVHGTKRRQGRRSLGLRCYDRRGPWGKTYGGLGQDPKA